MVTAFRTSETVTISELLAPGIFGGSLKNSETLTKWYEMVPFRKKNRSGESFFRNGNRFGTFMTHPLMHKTSETILFRTYETVLFRKYNRFSTQNFF